MNMNKIDKGASPAAPPRLRHCPCGRAKAVWRRVGALPERAPEESVCFLTDADFSDDYCDTCFAAQVPEAERRVWKRSVT